MAYQALYRKYRPKQFNDFIDQDFVKTILINSIKNNKISHAYLFSGPRGIGKTSMAKIFAQAINCLNFKDNDEVCGKCDNCIECENKTVDIIEIDAASNNGVDQIRELKNRINVVPDKLKYKVYIIDEVHMLTNSAFNALLKTLEEPPSHVIFILATTEFYEVPETIVSRCQCFNFNRISIDSLIKRLKYIASQENIAIDDDAIREIAEYSNGGLRDAIGMLDKMHAFKEDKINVDDFRKINGLISNDDIIDFYNDLKTKDFQKILDIISKISDTGYDFKYFIEKLMIYTRNIIVNNFSENKNEDVTSDINLVYMLNELLYKLRDATNSKILVEITVLDYINQRNTKNIKKSEEKVSNSEENEIKESSKIISREIIVDKKSESIEIDDDIKNIRINNTLATANLNAKNILKKLWNNLNEYFTNEKYNKVSQLLSDTEPVIVGEEYIILSTISDGLINNIYKEIDVVEEFIGFIRKSPSKIVLVTTKEFDKIKEEYKNNIKNGKKYTIQNENGLLIKKNDNNLIAKAISVFGSENIEIE